jgi:hypothetical protein
MAAALTLEQVFTHPRAFGVPASDPQRAICRIADGLPLGDLADNETVIRTIGGLDAVAALPKVPPLEFYLIAAIRTGKSQFTAALALHTALTICLDAIGKHELARIAVVSLDIDKARVVMSHLMAALERPDGLLRPYLERKPKPTTERVVIRRPDGRRVEILIAAGKRGGAHLVSRWTVACIFDEACRMLGQEDGVVNLDDARAAVIERLRLLRHHGAMTRLVAVSSPWAARGPIYDAVQEHFGRPTEALVIVRATGPELNPNLWTPEACEASRLDPRGSYDNDVLGEFIDPDGGWLSAMEVRQHTRAQPLERTKPAGHIAFRYVAAIDPGVAGNAWTLVIAGVEEDLGGDAMKVKYHIAMCRQWQGRAGEPLKARTVFAEMAPLLKAYGLASVYSDRWSGHLLAEIGDLSGVTVDVSQDTPEQTSKNHADFRTLLLDGRLELSPDRTFTADLLSIRKKLLPGGGIRYVAPVTRDGRHADYHPAAVLSVARLVAGPDWVQAMNAHQARGGGSPWAG